MRPTALITGASQGIGCELARLFAKAGYNLIIVARSVEKLRKLKDELEDHPVTVIPHDLSEPGAAGSLYEKVREKGKTVEVLVNNAGFGLNGHFSELPLKDQQQMIQVNVQALTELSHYFLEDIQAAPYYEVPKGILNVASTAAFQPGPKMAVYYATKAYVLSFSEALASELHGTGITITTLCPGATDTNFFTAAQADHTKLVQRMMSPKAVARAGFLGFIKGKRVVIPGAANQAMANATRFFPRSLTARMAHYMNQ